MASLTEKYKRPANVENLQVPKVDRLLWEQLKWQTKSCDAIRQHSVKRLTEGIMPMMLAMDHLANTKEVDLGLLKSCIGDTFKVLCHNVIKTNMERREQIKKELSGKYKAVCDNPPSATALFGDSLAEEVKKLDTKPVTITTKGPFLGKSGNAGASQYQKYRRPQSYSQNHGQNYAQNYGYKQKGQNQSGQFRGQANSFRSGNHSDKFGGGKKKWGK